VGATAGLGVLAPATAVGGAAGLLASAMLLATVVILGGRLLAEHSRRRAMPEILRGLRALNRELRTGADPLAAAEAAAGSARDAGGRVIGALVLLMRTGEAPATDMAAASASGAVSPADRVLDSLRSGWLLSRRHGVAFGRVVTGIADELADQLSADQARAGQVAGPRMSGYVMAALPLMGVLLGAGMGVNPVQVLLGSPLGNLLLVVGVALMCAGLLWSARIVGR
jgi:tight adherence protein B